CSLAPEPPCFKKEPPKKDFRNPRLRGLHSNLNRSCSRLTAWCLLGILSLPLFPSPASPISLKIINIFLKRVIKLTT
uniref:Uncharacterized protein n=1 Tax=Panthera leo TaxID=9689 RepID=A0A8C8XN04_PANLE